MQANNFQQIDSCTNRNINETTLYNSMNKLGRTQSTLERYGFEQQLTRFADNQFLKNETFKEKGKHFANTPFIGNLISNDIEFDNDFLFKKSQDLRKNHQLTVETEYNYEFNNLKNSLDKKTDSQSQLESLISAEEELKSIFSKNSDIQKSSFNQIPRLIRFNSLQCQQEKQHNSNMNKERTFEIKRPQNPHCRDVMFSNYSSQSPEQFCGKSGKFGKKLEFELKPKLAYSQECFESNPISKEKILESSTTVSTSTKSGGSDSYQGLQVGLSDMEIALTKKRTSQKKSALTDILEQEEWKQKHFIAEHTYQFENIFLNSPLSDNI